MESNPLGAEPAPENSSSQGGGQVEKKMAETLWDRCDVASKRVAEGLNATAELVKFFKKRAAAEEMAATGIKKMLVVEHGLGLASFPGRAKSADLLDSLQENAPSVKQAWATMVWNMQQTAMAHEDLVSRMNMALIAPLEVLHDVNCSSNRYLHRLSVIMTHITFLSDRVGLA